jgi:hypothetical protein
MYKFILLPLLCLLFLASAEGQNHVRANTIWVTYDPERDNIYPDGTHGYRAVEIHNSNNFDVDVTFTWNGWDENNRATFGRDTITVSATSEEGFGGHGGDSWSIHMAYDMRARPSK